MAKILVIAEEADIRDHVAGLVRSFEHDVLTASGSEEAEGITFKETPDLVVADLPAVAVEENAFLRKVRGKAETAILPVILIATPKDRDTAVRAFEAGATDILIKPFAFSEMRTRLQFALRGKIDPRHVEIRRTGEGGGTGPVSLEAGALLDLGKYRIMGPLDPGGSEKLFHAHHVGRGIDVALKALDPANAQEPTEPTRFIREADIAMRLDHPAIVRVLDVSLSEDLFYYAMEKLPSRSVLDALEEEGPLEESKVIGIGIQISSALASMHKKGFVHRDVKPDNILFVGDDRVKLIDFGLVIPIREERITQVGVLVGTPGFIAPENLTAFRTPKPSGDIFALGVTLYTMASGKNPYEGPDGSPVGLTKPILEEAPPLRSVQPEVSLGLSGVIQMMMTRNPARRLLKMSKVHDKLKELAGSPR